MQLSQSHTVSKDCTGIHAHIAVAGQPNFSDLNSAFISIVLFLETLLPEIGILPMNSSS